MWRWEQVGGDGDGDGWEDVEEDLGEGCGVWGTR